MAIRSMSRNQPYLESIIKRVANPMQKLLVLFAFVGLLAGQQQPPGAQQPSDDTFVLPPVSVKEVMAPVTVVDRDGKNVNGLTPLDFRLMDNGKRHALPVDTVSPP